MAINKEITKFSSKIEPIYIKTLEKILRDQTETTIPPLVREVSAFISEKIRFIRNNGGILSSSPGFNSNEKFSSLRYNNAMESLKVDLEAVITQLADVIDLANVSDNLSQSDFIENINFANEINAKLNNLRTLFDTNKEFNSYHADSFISDDNTYEATEFASRFSNGLYKLNHFEEDIVADEENDVHVTADILNDNIYERKVSGDIFSDKLLNGLYISVFSELIAGFKGVVRGESLNYPGIIVAYRIELSDIRRLNHISFNYFSNSEIDVLDVLYTTSEIKNISSQQWNSVEDLYSDPNNFGSFEFNFNTVSANEVVLILGQKFINSTEVSVTDDVLNEYMLEYDLNNTLGNEQSALKMIEEISRDAYLNTSKRDKTVYSLPASVHNLDNKLASMYTNFTKRLYGTVNRLNDFGGFLYDISIFNLKIKKFQYKQFSIHESETIVHDGSLINARLAKNDKVVDGTWINYYILYGNNKVRIIEKGDVVKDIIIVSELDTVKYETDFLIDANRPEDITIIKNGNSVSGYSLDLINTKVAKGFILDDIPRINDVLVISYPLPVKNEFNILYKPWNVNILNIEGMPNIRDNSLLNISNLNRVILETSGALGCYPISSRFKYDDSGDKRIYYAHKDDIFQEQIQSIEAQPTNDDGDFRLHSLQYGITDVSGIVKDMYRIPEYVDSSGVITTFVHKPKKDIYFGILNERVTDEIQPFVISSSKEYETDYPYLPGTLKARLVNEDENTSREIDIVEYYNTTTDNNYDKNKFRINTTNAELDEDVEVSYVPINSEGFSNSESNILSFNETNRFQETTNRKLKLLKFPYLDYSIIAQSTGKGAIWEGNNNIFSLKNNVSVRYIPIEITLNGNLPMNNVTDYVGGTTPDFSLEEYTFDIVKKNYMYYVTNNEIVFNTDLIGNIEIKYYVLNDRIKLRSELYRYDLSKYDITPEMFDILILTNTI